MKPKSKEKGQALIIITLAAVGLFAFAALAIDGSRSYSNKRHAQNTADTAALAAALASIRCTPAPCSQADAFAAAETAARARATSNGFTDNGDSVAVEVNLCSDAGITCQGLPANVTAAQLSEYIRVRIVSKIPATFGRIIGRQTLTSAVEAIARVQSTGSTSSTFGPAMIGLRPTDCGICSGGNVDLTVNGSGVFSNSTDSRCMPPPSKASIDFIGNGDYKADGGFTMPPGGALCAGGTSSVTGTTQLGSQIPYPPNIHIPAPNVTCPATEIGSKDDITHTVHRGNFSSTLQLLVGTYTFEPGNYCFAAGADIKTTVIANDVNFRIDGGEFKTNGGVNFTCNNVMVYGAGGSGIHFNGTGTTTCTDITFYMESGDVSWNGVSTSILKAPTSGTYKGLLIYLPYSNGSLLKINGTSGNQLTGSIIAPGSEIKVSGVSGSSGYNTQIIGSFITLEGASNTVINYDPSAQYSPPGSPTIQLTE
jgi:Flp pilus assembly protein TadG